MHVARTNAFLITLRPLPGVDATIALRRLLKYAGRCCGLQCIAIRSDALEIEPPAQGDIADEPTHACGSGG
jgi:hypothetical protein